MGSVLQGFRFGHVLIASKSVKAAKLQVVRIERAIARLLEEVVDIFMCLQIMYYNVAESHILGILLYTCIMHICILYSMQ